MSIGLKGFVTIQTLINNSSDTTALLGEISKWSLTYSKNVTEYTHTTYPGYRLVSMYHYNTETKSQLVVGQTLAEEVISVIADIYKYMTTHIRPYDEDDLKDTLLANFYNQISSISLGTAKDNGSLALPEYVSWTSLTNDSTAVTIWLCDESFQVQYPHYEITVVPPVSNLDVFFSSYTSVNTAITAVTPAVMMENIQTAKGDDPETYIRSYSYNYISPITPSDTLSTTWSVLVYGLQGDNVDSIKDAMVEFVVANSSHTRKEWEAILPDLFKRTEFIILPRWDKFAIANQTVQAGLYSSINDPVECITFAKSEANFYEDSHVAENTIILPHPYKTISLVVVNGENNIDGKAVFSDIFADYLPISTSSLDFNRMDEFTREWLIILTEMLVIAEDLTELSEIPTTMRKITRNDKLYLSYLYDNVNYLVAAASNYQ